MRHYYEKLQWSRSGGNFEIRVVQYSLVTPATHWDPEEVEEGPVEVNIKSRWRKVTGQYDDLSRRYKRLVDMVMAGRPTVSSHTPDIGYD